jgi:hypothetical protein
MQNGHAYGRLSGWCKMHNGFAGCCLQHAVHKTDSSNAHKRMRSGLLGCRIWELREKRKKCAAAASYACSKRLFRSSLRQLLERGVNACGKKCRCVHCWSQSNAYGVLSSPHIQCHLLRAPRRPPCHVLCDLVPCGCCGVRSRHLPLLHIVFGLSPRTSPPASHPPLLVALPPRH